MILEDRGAIRERVINGHLENTRLKRRYKTMDFKEEQFFVSLLAGSDGILSGNLAWEEDRNRFFGRFPIENPLNKNHGQAGFITGTPQLMLYVKSTGEKITIDMNERADWAYGNSSGTGELGKFASPRFLVSARIYGNARVMDDAGKTWYYLDVEITVNKSVEVQAADDFLPEWERA
jgi:hypothetical protein